MRYLVDTNVVSDCMRPQPEPKVTEWIDSVQRGELALSTITFGEIQKGVSKLAPGAKQAVLARWLNRLHHQYRGRVLPVDVPIARAWGRIAEESRRRGREISVPDALLVATAVMHNLVIVTRNERDFNDRGVQVVNPWNSV